MKKISVIGAGTMGADIGQVFASKGYDVVMYLRNPSKIDGAAAKLDKSLSRLVEKGKMTAEDKQALQSRITYTSELSACADSDVVIEAVAEDIQVKKDLFNNLEGICKPEAIFATNTSSISITEIANALTRKDKFIGMHFFNPVPVMKLVELIRGMETSDETFKAIFDLCQVIGKEPVEVKDSPGFIVNKILIPMINEAVCVLSEGVASAADIDKAMQLGANHPIGPLALSDLVGNDVVLHIMEILYKETGDPKYRPNLLLKQMVRGGLLGRKSGKGFFEYQK